MFLYSDCFFFIKEILNSFVINICAFEVLCRKYKQVYNKIYLSLMWNIIINRFGNSKLHNTYLYLKMNISMYLSECNHFSAIYILIKC